MKEKTRACLDWLFSYLGYVHESELFDEVAYRMKVESELYYFKELYSIRKRVIDREDNFGNDVELPSGIQVRDNPLVGVEYVDGNGVVVFQHPKDTRAARLAIWEHFNNA